MGQDLDATAAAIKAILDRLAGMPPPVPPTPPPPDTTPNPYCVDHPNDPVCVPPPATSGTPTVGTQPISGVYAAGTLNGGKTFSDVFTSFKGRVLAAPVVSAASNFFTVNVSGGSCPSWSTEVPMFGTFNFDFYCRPFFQNLLPWMRGVILIIFSVVAFQIAVL